MYILNRKGNVLVEAEIVQATKGNIPLKKDGWNFNWGKLAKETYSDTYLLRTLHSPEQTEGALHLKIEHEMLVMDALEIAPHNVGKKNKKFDHVAGCLIAFACRESFKIEGNYYGYLTFVAKTKLVNLYTTKYGAEVAMGQRMFIDLSAGNKLINKYLYNGYG